MKDRGVFVWPTSPSSGLHSLSYTLGFLSLLVFTYILLCPCSLLRTEWHKQGGNATYHPEGGVLDPEKFQSWMTSKVQQGYTTLTVAEGNYSVTPASGARAHIEISAVMSNVQLVMHGVNLWMTDRHLTALSVNDVRDLTISGVSVYYKIITTNQAKVIAIAEDGKSVDVEVSFFQQWNFGVDHIQCKWWSIVSPSPPEAVLDTNEWQSFLCQLTLCRPIVRILLTLLFKKAWSDVKELKGNKNKKTSK